MRIVLIIILVVLPLSPPTEAPRPARSDVAPEIALSADGPEATKTTPADSSDEGQSPEDQRPRHSPGGPIIRQLIPDSHAGGTRAPVNARFLLRLPGLVEVPGLHHHRLDACMEWRMAQARLESSSMTIVAPLLHPHAPPRLLS